jgi:hypothetical protein
LRIPIDDEGTLACPECGHSYVHQTQTIQSVGDDTSLAKATYLNVAGIAEDPVDADSVPGLPPRIARRLRRHAVTLLFTGECGHEFAITFEQNRGQTYLHLMKRAWVE